MEDKPPLLTTEGTQSLDELLDAIDELIARSKSTWPGYILVSRKRATALTTQLRRQLEHDESKLASSQAVTAWLSYPDAEGFQALLRQLDREQLAPAAVSAYVEAVEALDDFAHFVSTNRLYPGPNIWETFFAFGKRDAMRARAATLRAKLQPFIRTS